ncbi:MAG: FHA domain-containing protein [Bacteroidia bacterium]
MRCLECGYQNDESVSTCTKCGTLLMPSSKIKKPEAPAKKQETANPEIKVSGNPTIIGKAVDLTAWDVPESTSPKTVKNHTYFTCAACNYYPLKEAVSSENACPNCGSTGEAVKSENKQAGTMKLGDFQLGEAQISVTLSEEGGEKSIRMEGEELKLNRETLDPNNKSISSKKHARLHLEKGELFLEDESSNKATFVQVSGKVKLENGMRIILGNKMYTISIEEK